MKGPAVRRRFERIPEHLPRVGERPAGTESGKDFLKLVLSLAEGDFGWRVLRGVEAGLTGLVRERASAGTVMALVRTKLAGLTKSAANGLAVDVLDRLAKRDGSTFSESWKSVDSTFRLPTGVEGEAVQQCVNRCAFMSKAQPCHELTILSVLQTCQGLKPSLIEGSKGLTGDRSHGDDVEEQSSRDKSNEWRSVA